MRILRGTYFFLDVTKHTKTSNFKMAFKIYDQTEDGTMRVMNVLRSRENVPCCLADWERAKLKIVFVPKKIYFLKSTFKAKIKRDGLCWSSQILLE